MSDVRYKFPEGYLWGAGASGIQHEGSPLADGAAPSAMYRWAHSADRAKKVGSPSWITPPLDTFDVTADFYRRFKEDISLMRDMGLKIYNFEVTWPRIMPEGTGALNQAGLDFYDRLVDEFLAAGITPLCNLYVWDHPASLEDRGGWFNRDMADWFADYATVLFERFGDRVPYWSTVCEVPLIFFFCCGAMGPERSEAERLTATHHVLLGQGRAVQALRASGANRLIGNQHVLSLPNPASDRDEDVAEAQARHAHDNLLFLDSQFRGEYPKTLTESLGEIWPADAIKDGDLETISEPIDFFGLDYGVYEAAERAEPEEQTDEVDRASGAEGVGRGVHDSLVWIRDRYGDIPIFILENGCPVEETVEAGCVHDTERLAYFENYLGGVHQAIQEGIDVRGSIVWSFLDGWEFGYGLSLRYGLVHVDFDTQERIVKDSGLWYRDVIANNGF